MKKWSLFLSMYFCLCLLAACGETRDEVPPQEVEPPFTATTTCRVITSRNGRLLLAGCNTDTNIYTYTLSPEDDNTDIHPGTLVDITFDGSIMEIWPAQFSGVSAVSVREDGFDDRCALYLDVLEDLWEKDSGLNNNLSYIGADLSGTSLTPAEQSAVAWAFAEKYGAELVQGTWDELVEQGYITSSPLCIDTSEASPAKPNSYFYEWKNGCFFSITEQPMEGAYSLTPVTFDAWKWRSSLGAYRLCDCTALQSAAGDWSDYQIGSEMIS